MIVGEFNNSRGGFDSLLRLFKETLSLLSSLSIISMGDDGNDLGFRLGVVGSIIIMSSSSSSSLSYSSLFDL